MTVLPISIWWYTGIEAMPLACEETVSAKKNVPRGMLWGMAIVIILNIGVFFVGVSVPTNTIDPQQDGLGQTALLDSSYPQAAGFQKLFGLSDYSSPIILMVLFPGGLWKQTSHPWKSYGWLDEFVSPHCLCLRVLCSSHVFSSPLL
jgi:amino acid transporter